MVRRMLAESKRRKFSDEQSVRFEKQLDYALDRDQIGGEDYGTMLRQFIRNQAMLEND